MDWNDYAGREQSGVKHLVLRGYLEKLAYKIGFYGGTRTFNYVDGFAGPWKHATEDYRDTSPFIAIRELRRVQEGLVAAGRPRLRVRCLFIEKKAAAFADLQKLTAQEEGVEVTAVRGEFEDNIDQVGEFGRSGPRPFAFFFIDPTGWTGYGLEAITPLFRQERCEVLINFMIKDIKRFVADDTNDARQSFIDLFGSEDCLDRWKGLEGLDREEAIVETYCEQVRKAGNFAHVASAVVLHPKDDRTHFYLVYATRSLEGLRTFREIEDKAMQAQEKAHNRARQRSRVERTGQREMFGATVLGSSHQASLQTRCYGRARAAVQHLLTTQDVVPYDRLVVFALGHPMTSERRLKLWLKAWKASGDVEYLGLEAGKRVPKLRKGHTVRWRR